MSKKQENRQIDDEMQEVYSKMHDFPAFYKKTENNLSFSIFLIVLFIFIMNINI